jgi:uncharacterized protein
MKSPCKAACKNVEGICVGCARTIQEVIHWQHYSDEQRENIMAEIKGERSTHLCPNCDHPSFCGNISGDTPCWCYDLDITSTQQQTSEACLCRHCLAKLARLK